MDQAQNLRQQAERCFDLARGVTNRDAREQLELFGHEFARRASEMEEVRALGVKPDSIR
jgi:hypothetical protein